MISIDNVSKAYGQRIVLDHISCNIENGICGILGPNGAGKTTFMKILCTLLKPDKGHICYEEQDIYHMDDQYRMIIGYVQQKAGYYPNFTAYEFLHYIAELKEINYDSDTIINVLKAVALEGEKDRKLKCFSGGMLQRINIAQALLNNPRILIMDEPTAGLDPNERVRLKNMLCEMANERIIIIATHIISDVEDIANQVLLIKKGKIILSGTIEDIHTQMTGKIWECPVESAGELQRLKACGHLCSLKKNMARIISPTAPKAGAIEVAPTLEEAYLSFFDMEA